jgi:hypothetical protein
MVHLLDLPNEILEMIVKYSAHDLNPIFFAGIHLPRGQSLSEALVLRLVHSRFASVAASVIFADCTVSLIYSYPIPNFDKPALSNALRFLASPLFSQHVRSVHIDIGQTVSGFSGLYELLRCALPFIRKLTIKTYPPHTVDMWTQSDPLPHAPHLRELLLMDDQPWYLPHILRAATALQSFELRGPHPQPQYKVQYPASCRDVQPIPQIIVDGFGNRAVQSFLQAMELRTRSLFLINRGGQWKGSAEEHFAALSCLADCNALAEVYVQYPEHIGQNGIPEYAMLGATRYLEECGDQRARLLRHLSETCTNRDVVLLFDTIRGDWQEVVAKAVPPITPSILKETHRIAYRETVANRPLARRSVEGSNT